jgi:hypothetical protein
MSKWNWQFNNFRCFSNIVVVFVCLFYVAIFSVNSISHTKAADALSTGDIYSNRIVNDSSAIIKFDTNKSVLVSGSQTTITNPNSPGNTFWLISPYSNILWQTIKTQMRTNIANITRNATIINNSNYTFVDGGTWYLNSDSQVPSSNINPEKHVDGKVWHVTGNLIFTNATFCGIGTIVVDGTILINGNLSYGSCGTGYSKNSLGILSSGSGSINIANTVSNLIGAYYTEGQINFL